MFSRIIRKSLPALAAFSAVFAAGCYPDSITSIQDLDVVATIYDVDYDFSANLLYAMPDSIIHLCDIEELELTGCIEITRDFDDQILTQIMTAMTDLGYTFVPTDQIDPGDPPDVVLLVSAVATRTTIIYSWPWWSGYGWWPGWGGWPGYGPGWGWYYPPIAATSYETGSIIVSMADPLAPVPIDMEQVLPVKWSGVLNGLLGSSSSANAQRVSDGIDQMFVQSPYLRTGS